MRTKVTIRNCESTFRFQRPELWSELSETAAPDVRHCALCNCDVFFCKTDEETITHAKVGHCIARELPDEKQLRHVYVGKPMNMPILTPEQEEAGRLSARERAIDDS